MKKTKPVAAVKAPPPQLSALPDVLNAQQYCAVFQFSMSHFWVLKRHNALPVPPLKMKLRVVRFSKAAVEAFINGARKAS